MSAPAAGRRGRLVGSAIPAGGRRPGAEAPAGQRLELRRLCPPPLPSAGAPRRDPRRARRAAPAAGRGAPRTPGARRLPGPEKQRSPPRPPSPAAPPPPPASAAASRTRRPRLPGLGSESRSRLRRAGAAGAARAGDERRRRRRRRGEGGRALPRGRDRRAACARGGERAGGGGGGGPEPARERARAGQEPFARLRAPGVSGTRRRAAAVETWNLSRAQMRSEPLGSLPSLPFQPRTGTPISEASFDLPSWEPQHPSRMLSNTGDGKPGTGGSVNWAISVSLPRSGFQKSGTAQGGRARRDAGDL